MAKRSSTITMPYVSITNVILEGGKGEYNGDLNKVGEIMAWDATSSTILVDSFW